MNGPNPVWMLAMKKLKPSRPRRLRADGAGSGRLLAFGPRFAKTCTSRYPRLFVQPVFAARHRLRTARGAQHHHGLPLLVFRRRFELIACQVEGDAFGLSGRREVERVPIDRDLAAADAEKTAEIDDCGARHSGLVDDDVDDAAHVLAGCARHRLTQDGLCLVLGQDGRRSRRRGGVRLARAGSGVLRLGGGERPRRDAGGKSEPTREQSPHQQYAAPNRTHRKLRARPRAQMAGRPATMAGSLANPAVTDGDIFVEWRHPRSPAEAYARRSYSCSKARCRSTHLYGLPSQTAMPAASVG